MSYNSLLSYGDIIPLKITCNVKKLFDEIEGYSFSQYNPRKDIKRTALSITSLDGSINGVDLDSIKEYILRTTQNIMRCHLISLPKYIKIV